jgi:P27 family predicted phage terminase small subunit
MLQRGRKSRASLAVVPARPRDDDRSPPPPPPAHLGEPEQHLWTTTLADYAAATQMSLAVLRTALEAHQRARECREVIARDGMTLPARGGQLKVHPLLATERDARQAFLAGVKALGLEL